MSPLSERQRVEDAEHHEPEVRKYIRAFDDRVFDDIYATKLDMSIHDSVRTYALSSKENEGHNPVRTYALSSKRNYGAYVLPSNSV